jgi:hypothetical protein
MVKGRSLQSRQAWESLDFHKCAILYHDEHTILTETEMVEKVQVVILFALSLLVAKVVSFFYISYRFAFIFHFYGLYNRGIYLRNIKNKIAHKNIQWLHTIANTSHHI